MLLDLPVTKRTLANGLDVIVHEDRHAPLVAVCVWYHVGSKNERVGRTGFAHLFEHLMFEGAAHQPRGYFAPLQEAGAALNGSTSADRTNYWEVVPTEATALALWMEADRMGWMQPALSQERFDTQREVVLNERRQSYENRPYGVAQFALAAALFPPDHPYHWPTIGDPADLRSATVDDARAFLAEFYHPGNASLAIAGDVDTAGALQLAEDLFGGIRRGGEVLQPEPPLPRARARRIVLEDDVELARLYLAWPSPQLFASGDAELDLFSDILANGRTSRLYRTLIHERRIAIELVAHQVSRELTGMFQIVATVASGHGLAEIDAAIVEALTAAAGDGPSDAELSRGRTQAEAIFLYRLQTLGGFGGKADQLNAYNVYQGDPEGFADDLVRYVQATGAGVRNAVVQWLDPADRLALSVVPRGHRELALPGSEPVEVV